ncbi:MAG: class I SAM-dependent methyltransferase [Phycisphaerales bacterium]
MGLGLSKLARYARIRLGPGGAVITDLHKRLDGQLKVEECAWLFRMARGVRTIIEIGSYRGKSAILLAKGSADVGGRVWAIDPHLNFDGTDAINYMMNDDAALRSAIAEHGVADRVTPVVATSAEARKSWPGTPVDLLWVDGDHRYEGCLLDLRAWGPLVREGGVVACHDYTDWEGVRRAWSEAIEADGAWRVEGRVRSIIWARRVRPASAPR